MNAGPVDESPKKKPRSKARLVWGGLGRDQCDAATGLAAGVAAALPPAAVVVGGWSRMLYDTPSRLSCSSAGVLPATYMRNITLPSSSLFVYGDVAP